LPAQTTFSPDAEGFIRNWLVLAPIPLEGDSGTFEIEKAYLRTETTMTPKPDEKTMVNRMDLAWTPHQASDFYIDFLQAFGQQMGEYVAAYAVTYVLAEEEMNVTLAMSSNDQGKGWLNGKPVYTVTEARTLEKDTDRAEVTLVKGQNVLAMKVINEVNNWQGCARFLKDGQPVTHLKISLTPQP
jgi:hypothetical protein